jgi:histidyl-tRNA synthetase
MIQLIRGFRDILPGEVETWQHIEKVAVELLESFGFKELRLPIMEKTELFARSIGEDTDIVEKEMYTFPDRKGELITLRPEATAAVVRSYIQHKMYAQDPVRKFYTIGPMFRRERPQKGRYRQFYQINAEVFGVESALVDAQLILLLVTLCRRLSVTDVLPHVNSLGCPRCRQGFKEALSAYLDRVSGALCEDCRRRRTRNPLRTLDCKVPSCREALAGAPSIQDHLDDDCRAQFDLLRDALETLGVAYEVDPRLVRGLDYYTRATFEIQTGALGAQSAVAGGGRYDNLVRALGGPDIPATGFAVGFDRLAELVATGSQRPQQAPELFIAALGERSRMMAFEWTAALGLAGIATEMDFENRSLKSQMKRADRQGAAYVLLVGDDELERGEAILRDMKSSEQETLPLSDAVERIRNRLRG